MPLWPEQYHNRACSEDRRKGMPGKRAIYVETWLLSDR